jgi:hypothetical protein
LKTIINRIEIRNEAHSERLDFVKKNLNSTKKSKDLLHPSLNPLTRSGELEMGFGTEIFYIFNYFTFDNC